jgi:hypothetical protein
MQWRLLFMQWRLLFMRQRSAGRAFAKLSILCRRCGGSSDEPGSRSDAWSDSRSGGRPLADLWDARSQQPRNKSLDDRDPGPRHAGAVASPRSDNGACGAHAACDSRLSQQ